MSKAFKFNDNMFLDSDGIAHGHYMLKSYLIGRRPITAPIYIDEIHTKNLITGWYYWGYNSDTLVGSPSTSALSSNLIPVDWTVNGTYYFSGLPMGVCSYYVVGFNENGQAMARTSAYLKSSQTSSTLAISQSKINLKPTGATGTMKYIAIEFYVLDSDKTWEWFKSNYNIQFEVRDTTTYKPGKALGYTSGLKVIDGSNDYTYWMKFDGGLMIQGGMSIFSTGGTAANDSYKTIEFPERFCVNSYVTVVASPAYYASSQVSTPAMLSTNITPSPNNIMACTFYRRFSYLPTSDSGQTALYTQPLRFCWLAIGRWR